MTKNTWLFLLLSAVFGLGAVYLANNWLSDATDRPEANYVQVVEAAQTVSVGTILEAKQLRVRTYPQDLVPKETYTGLEQVVGKVAKETLYAGDFVRPERVAEKGEGSSLASLIGDSKRALTIRVNDVVGVAGFLLPGDKVDVLNTFKQKGKSSRDTVTEVVLANVKILAIDQTAQNNENRPRVVRAVTVEVTLEQAEVLMNARSRGGLQLALRNPVDDSKVELARFSDPVEEEKATVAAVQPAPVAPALTKPKVHLIRGIAEEIISVEADQAGGSPQ